MNNKEVASVYNKFESLHVAAHNRRTLMWVMESNGEILSQHIIDYLEKEIKRQKVDLTPSAVFSVLVTSTKLNYVAQERRNFLEIAFS